MSVHMFIYPSTCYFRVVIFLPMIFSVYTKQIPPGVEIRWSLPGSYSALWFHKSLNLKHLISCCLSCLYSTSYLEAEASIFCLNRFPADFVLSQEKLPISLDCPSVVFISRCFSRKSQYEYENHIVELPFSQTVSRHLNRPHFSTSEQVLVYFSKVSLLSLVSWSRTSYSGPKRK